MLHFDVKLIHTLLRGRVTLAESFLDIEPALRGISSPF